MASKIVVNLDTSKGNFLITKCKQNDDLILETFIYENGLALDLTNKEISIQALKADGTYIIQNTEITKENNKFTANLVRDFTRVPGTTNIEIVLVESSKQNTTFSFCLEVVGSVIKGAVESGNTPTILEALQEKIVEAGAVKEETEQLIQNGGAATTGQVKEINAQLEHKANITEVVKKGQVDLDEMTERTLQAIQGGSGANFTLLSIPRDGSVNYLKTDFLEVGVNKLKPCVNSQSGIDVTLLNNKISVYGTATKSDFIKIGEVAQLPVGQYTLYKKDVENPSGSNVMYLRGSNSLGEVVNIAELPKASESVTFTVSELYSNVHLTFYASNTKSYVFKCYIQLNSGSTMMEYENYEEILKNSNYVREDYISEKYNIETPFLLSNVGNNIITFNNGVIEIDNKLTYLFLVTKKGEYVDISSLKGKSNIINEKTGLHYLYTDKENIISYYYNQAPTNKKDLYFIGSFYYNSTYKIVLSVNLNCKYSLYKNIFNFVGDSLTYGYLDGSTRMPLPYPSLIENKLGCICNNYGISGTRISQTQDNAMSSDNRINSLDLSATCNVIKGGTNDYLGGVSIGTLDDYKNGIYTTFLGGYEYLINKLYEKFPGKPILLITPPQTWSLSVINGQTLLQFVDAIIQLGEKYSLPVLDLYRNGQYCKASMKQVGADGKYILTTDGVHYTQYYVSNILTPIISDFIKRNINI